MRIVCHTCSNTEIVCALGAGGDIVGVDDHSDYPPEITLNVPKIGADLTISMEKIRALKPDLVISSLTVPGHEDCVSQLKAAGFNVLVCDPVSVNDVCNDIARIASAIGCESAGKRLIDRFKLGMEPGPSTDHRPTLLVEWWPKPVIVPGKLSWVSDMIHLAGASNPWADVEVKSMPIDDEMIRSHSIDLIVMSWCGVASDKYHSHVVSRRPHWNNQPAIRNNTIYGISEAFLGRPGPRLVEGLRELKKIVANYHPMHSTG